MEWYFNFYLILFYFILLYLILFYFNSGPNFLPAIEGDKKKGGQSLIFLIYKNIPNCEESSYPKYKLKWVKQIRLRIPSLK